MSVDFQIRQLKYLNNIIAQDHRFIKKRVGVRQPFLLFGATRKISLFYAYYPATHTSQLTV